MDRDRDLCWLAKKVSKDITGFYLNLNDGGGLVGSTIKEEFPLLFENGTYTDSADASVVFLIEEDEKLGGEGYRIEKQEHGYRVISGGEKGLLYGMYGLHRILAVTEDSAVPENDAVLENNAAACEAGQTPACFPYESVPDQKIRMINHWDNFDGSIERGYAGESLFYTENRFRGDFELIRRYARLLASVGINAISINNVNVHKLETFFIEREALKEIKKIADVFQAYGIRLFLSVNYAAPITVGGLNTADPLSPEVEAWWRGVADRIYEEIPAFAGFVVKADSEGEPGPFTYGRNHDEGANMLARALMPHGGLIIWRCFVYNCSQDWWDRSADRARAAYDIFMELDGKFEENVILQIKNGPIDFQIREPISPLFGALKKTNQILEFQITQEYTGHQKDVCYLVPMWKEVLDYDTKHGEAGAVKQVIREHSQSRFRSGIAGVGNVGMDRNWTGSKLAQANLYGFGRLCWDNGLTSEAVAGEWVRLSFSLAQDKQETLKWILTTSRDTYEDYTCPLAVGFMCRPHIHYGADVDGYEYQRWGTYHYADRDGVGRDRTQRTGTAYTRQYSDGRFAEYENLETCPDELLLFFHHVPYTHVLHSGKTVIQHIYDTHFCGVETVKQYQEAWKGLEGFIDQESYQNGEERLALQLENAISWRDQINTYFFRKSGIPDEKGRKIYH